MVLGAGLNFVFHRFFVIKVIFCMLDQSVGYAKSVRSLVVGLY